MKKNLTFKYLGKDRESMVERSTNPSVSFTLASKTRDRHLPHGLDGRRGRFTMFVVHLAAVLKTPVFQLENVIGPVPAKQIAG